jgi:hypothetical protein
VCDSEILGLIIHKDMIVAPIVVEIWVASQNVRLLCPVHTGLIFQTDAAMGFNLKMGE